MKEDRPRIDWQEVYARLDRARQAVEAGGQTPPEEVQRILRERAEALARPPEEKSLPSAPLECLVFSLGGDRCGIETAHVVHARGGLWPPTELWTTTRAFCRACAFGWWLSHSSLNNCAQDARSDEVRSCSPRPQALPPD